MEFIILLEKQNIIGSPYNARRKERKKMSLNQTPAANRLHIAIFGKQNSGKSTLLNAITDQDIAIVSETKGATADPVYKAMEIAGIGPCMLIDTAGFDDKGSLGKLRVEKTQKVLDKTDVAILVITDDEFFHEKKWEEEIKKRKVPLIIVINDFENSKEDSLGLKTPIKKDHALELKTLVKNEFGKDAIVVNAKKRIGREKLVEAVLAIMPEKFEEISLTLDYVKEGDLVLLVMPQDIGAPKGRLILPQVQTTRDLLDNKCMVISVTHDKLEDVLKKLKNPPDLIITDSQVFPYVYERKPKESRLTSFSVLYAGYKGDRKLFEEGMKEFNALPLDKHLKVLIAEACTHAPQTEDIGRIKIPNILKKKYGERIAIDVVSGSDFPENINEYDLVIHCGGCMFNRKLMLNRLNRIKEAKVSVTNYGIFLANAAGILDKIE